MPFSRQGKPDQGGGGLHGCTSQHAALLVWRKRKVKGDKLESNDER